jgi:hypothetical protein
MTVVESSIVGALKLAERHAGGGHLHSQTVTDTSGTEINYLRVLHSDSFDILVFAGSAMDSCSWTEVLAVMDYCVRPLGGLGGIWDDSLHLRVHSDYRNKLLPFYCDLINSVNPADVESTVWDIIDSWSDIFGRVGNPLSQEEQIGLFGELVILQKLVNQFGSSATNWWTGPDAEKHDFVSNQWEIEVKSSMRPDPVAHIHPIDQLEPEPVDFYLMMIGLKKGNKTLPEMIEDTRNEILENVDKNKFNRSLKLVGYDDEHAHQYPDGYEVSTIRFLEIDDSTPVFRPSAITPGTIYEDVSWTLRESSLPFNETDNSFWSSLE